MMMIPSLLPSNFMAPGDGAGNPAGSVVMILGFVAIFYFILIRPQQKQRKQHQEMVKNLKKGDNVVTAGGIIGTVIYLTDDRVTVKSGETRLEVERSKIGQVGVKI